MGIPAGPDLVGDTTNLAREAQGWLVDLIKINTTNPPGNEQAAAKYIADILTKEGITTEILVRPSISFRLPPAVVPMSPRRARRRRPFGLA